MKHGHVDFTKQSPLTTISIGPGIRGIERGIERTGTGLNHIAYVEIEAFIIENLVAEMEAGVLAPAIIWSDCKTFPSELFKGKINLLLAGYSCQPFSNAGKRLGAEDPRHLYPHIERAIDIIRPDVCFFENVRGHVTLGLREVIESLERLGYRVHWGIFSAEETGASHKRERVFIMGIRKDCLVESGSQRWNDEQEGYEQVSEDKERKLSLSGRQWETVECGVIQSSELGHSKNKRCEQPCYSWQWRSGPANNGQLGNTNNTRLQGWLSEVCRECSYKWITRANGPFARVARPGQPQQAWEHPRVISRAVESHVGLSAHGYHFREDVLRALGNSVYPDTAELAWITLWNKFLK